MPYVALKEMKFHGHRYAAGEPLPSAVERWPFLRQHQRREFISLKPVVLPTPAAEPAPVELVAPPLTEPAAPETARRESRKPRR